MNRYYNSSLSSLSSPKLENTLKRENLTSAGLVPRQLPSSCCACWWHSWKLPAEKGASLGTPGFYESNINLFTFNWLLQGRCKTNEHSSATSHHQYFKFKSNAIWWLECGYFYKGYKVNFIYCWIKTFLLLLSLPNVAIQTCNAVGEAAGWHHGF